MISSATVNATGGNTRNEAGIFSWSLAEMPFAATAEGSQIVLTGGVLQPVKSVLQVPVNFPAGYVKVFPTIATDYISVYGNIPWEGTVSVSITSLAGKLVFVYTTPVNNEIIQKKILVSSFDRGMYFVQIRFSNSAGLSYQTTYEIIKI